MWKKEDVKSQNAPETVPGIPTSLPPAAGGPLREGTSGAPLSSKTAACISQGIRIKGEVTGSEDLFIDGHLEGKVNLSNGSLTIGPNGEVKADIFAREVIVRGRVDGKIVGREKIQLWSTGNVAGDLQTERLVIEDGALLRGRVEIETGRPLDAKAGLPNVVGTKHTAVAVGSGPAAQ